MSRRLSLYCALVIALIGAGLYSPARAADELPTLPAVGETVTAQAVAGAEKLQPELPRTGVLLAMSRWGATTFAVINESGREQVRLGRKPTGPLVFSQRGHRLAYMLREGFDPTKNDVEILDFLRGPTLVVKPAAGHAILGFALAPEGKQLAYAAMNIQRSRSTDVRWHVGIADLQRREIYVTLASSSEKIAEEGIPVPFEWSRQTGRIYLQGWVPFRGMIKQSIWSANPEGNELVKVIAEPSYVGVPELSPDGLRFSYLASNPDILPRDYVPPPGPPPGNLLSVIDLVSGDQSPWARAGRGAFGAHAWSSDGKEVLAVEQDWAGGRFRDDEIRRIGKSSSISVAKIERSGPPKQISGLLECSDHELWWVEQDRSSSRLYSKSGQGPVLRLSFHDGILQLLGCFNG